ncbi:MAG TPA: VCBS repeat-containing protein, partial [Planctomycetota bacterium]|nr:VCBS repeat-containing protein [Planctomycetota bacterium]
MRRIPLRWVTFSLLVLLSACDSEAEVENTIPANGQFGVDPRTIVAVRLSSTMSSTDLEKNVDTRNITVFGDQTEGAYSGTIQPARFSNLFGGQTIEQFVAGQTSPDPNAPPPQEAEEEANTDLDALVFLLEQGAQFKPGERVTVVVDSRVTVRGSAMNSSTSFTFTIAGGSAPAAGEFFVETVDPSTEMTTVGLSPDVRATFSMAAQTSTLADGIRVRGDQSGLHPEGTTLAGSGNTTTEVIRRLEADDAFIPGERVTVTFGPGIRASGDVRLSPFALRFQAKPGAISGLLEGETGWNDQILDASGMEPLGIVAADFRTQVAGVEIAAVYADRVTLFVQTAPFVWTPLDTTFVPGGTVRGVVASDTNDDGVSELVVVIERNGGGGRLSRFEVGDDGDFGALGDPFDFPAGAIHAVALADLDASGSPELVVAHGDTTFVPTGPGGTPGQATRTGTITFFESRQGAGAELDPTNPEALLEFGWARIHRPISTFESARRIELEDLDRDGRIDLIAETDRGLVLYRNQSSPTTPFSFRRVGLLSGPNGDPVVPESWAAFDIDRDGDIDIVSWVGGQSLFHENRQPARDEIEPGAPPAGLLFESIPPESFTLANVPTQGSLVLASNLDGDDLGAPDLVVTRPNGTIDIHVGSPDAIFAFETPRSYAGAAGSALAVIADIDGDTALDVVRVTAQGIRALISDSTLVDPVEVPARSQYRLVLDVEDENTIAVRAIGDIASRFSGYSLALDYDETVLEYLGFVIPSEFERKATFTLCPNLQLLGCSGVAGARMEYQRDTVGAPTEDLLLGTFRFRLRTVEDETETTIELRDFESGNQTFNNSVMTKVGAFSQEILVTDLGDPIEIVVEPPAPEPGPELSITCSVVERLAKSYRARIEWSSPRGTEFERVVVTVNGKPIADENGPIGPVDWNRGNVTFLDDSAASVAVEVEALLSGQEPGDSMAPVETCELVS